MRSVGLTVRDFIAFPAAVISGAEPAEVKEKALPFIHSTARIAFTAGIIWALYKGQYSEPLRNVNITAVVGTATIAYVTISLELISFLANIYLIKTARSKLAVGCYLSILMIFQSIAQTYNQWKTQPPIFFAVSFRHVSMKIDIFSALMNFALVKVPEARLSIGLYTFFFGAYQMYVYTSKRWNLIEAPTNLALKGILHISFAIGWLAIYEKYRRDLAKSGLEKETYLYKAAQWMAPSLTRLVTS